MTQLDLVLPSAWPDPRVLDGTRRYSDAPPFRRIASDADGLLAVVAAISTDGINTIRDWLDLLPKLKIRLIVVVWPTCVTKQHDLLILRRIVASADNRIEVRLRILRNATARSMTSLCFSNSQRDSYNLIFGYMEDLGHDPDADSHGVAFGAAPLLIDSFRKYFNGLWAKARPIGNDGSTDIPHLVLPQGTAEAALLWDEYRLATQSATPDTTEEETVAIDPETGEITLTAPNGEICEDPASAIGLTRLDPVSIWVGQLYDRGWLVSIDKAGRLPPLDVPVNPRIFGDDPDLYRGGVVRKVSMRASVIDDAVLRKLEKHRLVVSSLLRHFTIPIAEKMRWLPDAARPLLEAELERANIEGQRLFGNALTANSVELSVDDFVKSRRERLKKDLAAMATALGRPDSDITEALDEVMKDATKRLGKAKTGNFLPKLSYSRIAFSMASSDRASPWEQVSTFLIGLAHFPRKALTDRFFGQGLEVDVHDLMEAMDVAGDTVCQEWRARNIRMRCKADLEFLDSLPETVPDARKRCELVKRLIEGESSTSMMASLTEAAAQ